MSGRNWIRRLVVLAGLVAAGIWDEVVFAALPVYLTARWGAVPAFAVVAPAYVVIGTAISVALVGRRRGRYARPTGVQRLLERWAATTEDSRIRRRLVAGGLIGFILSSWLLGGILTSWILHSLGLRQKRVRHFLAANTIWAITFVGQYTGLTALLIALF